MEAGEVKRHAIAFVAAALAMLPLDFAWLTLVAPRFYGPRIGHLMAASPSFGPAVVFYLLYWLGIVALVVAPALARSDRAAMAVRNGALFGLVAYATYDLTNEATLRDWPTSVTVVDLAWGTFLTAVASAASFVAAKRFGG